MERNPSGGRDAPVESATSRSEVAATVARWGVIAVIVALVVIAAPAAPAEDQPEWSVQAALASRSLLLDATAADGVQVVVGERGHILSSTDGGESWQQAEVPTRSALTGVFFHDRNLGWAVGHDGVILRTRDGGTSWERVRWAPEEENPFMDVWFSSAEEGFAIGAYGTFYVTTDGGSTWTFEPLGEDDFHLHYLAQAADGRLYIAAEAGMIYRSDDGGETWVDLPSPYGGSFFGALPLEGDSLLVFGLRGHLFRSDDAGESWSELETGTVAMLTAGIRLGDGTIVITGLGGAVLASTDGGRTFALIQQPDRRGIAAVVEVDGQLLLVGEFGVKLLPETDLLQQAERSPAR